MSKVETGAIAPNVNAKKESLGKIGWKHLAPVVVAIIIALIPLALKGLTYRPIGAGPLLRRHLLIYGVGGIVVPFIGIKLIDMLLVVLHLV